MTILFLALWLQMSHPQTSTMTLKADSVNLQTSAMTWTFQPDYLASEAPPVAPVHGAITCYKDERTNHFTCLNHTGYSLDVEATLDNPHLGRPPALVLTLAILVVFALGLVTGRVWSRENH